MDASVCIATYAKPAYLHKTLDSIFRQSPQIEYEVVVVDDGSPDADTGLVCRCFPVRYYRIDRQAWYRNPAAARNVAYRQARGDIIIAQADDVYHVGECIQPLVDALKPGRFVLASVINVDADGRPYADEHGKGFGDRLRTYVGPQKCRPLFFLGALWRDDLYAVGGNDEDFTEPSGEDKWFAACLRWGRCLTPVYLGDTIGHHQHHQHTTDYAGIERSQAIYRRKMQDAKAGRIPWCSSGGPWPAPASAG